MPILSVRDTLPAAAPAERRRPPRRYTGRTTARRHDHRFEQRVVFRLRRPGSVYVADHNNTVCRNVSLASTERRYNADTDVSITIKTG